MVCPFRHGHHGSIAMSRVLRGPTRPLHSAEMATDVVRADQAPAEATIPAARPYAPSWLNVLIDWIDRAPGPTWAAYIVLGLISVALSVGQGWLAGIARVGEVSLNQVGWGVVTIAFIAAVHVFERVAEWAFDTVRPLTSLADGEAARLRYEVAIFPAVPGFIVLVAAFPLTLFGYVTDPAASGIVGYPLVALVLRGVYESLFSAVLLVLICQAIRQLRLVTRILDRVTRIDLFHPRPLYAFSRLTGGIGISLILVVVMGFILAPSPTQATNLYYAVWYVGFVGFGLVVFVVPLLGLHGRLVDEKERLQAASDDRLKSVLAELNRDVDGLDLGRADALNKTLASVLQQRDVLARLPTWPWSTTTLRAFVSAILLPLALFLVQRVLGQLL